MAAKTTTDDTDSTSGGDGSENPVLAALPIDGPNATESLALVVKLLLSAFLTVMFLYWAVAYFAGVQLFAF